MGLFQQINSEASRQKLDFLLIGGHAVNFYGYFRETADLDLLVNHDARDKWITLLSGLGYTILYDGGPFIQFTAPQNEAWPVDLMVVRDPTFRRLLPDARECEIYGVKLMVPALEHLLALKLHALKHSHLGRYLKDFLDVENLIRINKLDWKSENIRRLVLKYADEKTYEKICHACETT